MADPGPSSPSQAPGLGIDVVRHADIWENLGVSDESLARAAEAAFHAGAARVASPCEVTIVLTDDMEMRELNRAWRGKDASTNVLSFPAGAMTEHGNHPCPLGDIVLAAETVQCEAEAQGVSPADHVSHLVVHGVLHLLGFAHDADDDADKMEALETMVLAGLGIADPYAAPAAKMREEISP